MISCLAVGRVSFAGSLLRYLTGLVPLRPQSGFPAKTFLINIPGSFAIGLIAAQMIVH